MAVASTGLQPGDTNLRSRGLLAPETPHSTKISNINQRASCSLRAKALQADSLRSIFPMDCSRWKVSPSGTHRVRRTPPFRLTSKTTAGSKCHAGETQLHTAQQLLKYSTR